MQKQQYGFSCTFLSSGNTSDRGKKVRRRHSRIKSHFNNPEPYTESRRIKDRPCHFRFSFLSISCTWEKQASEPMQPLTSPKTQHRGCAVKMGVPATLQPDGAWRRPAHTGPSLAKAPEGPQSPNCTRPPRWVQKQERKARRDRAPVRLVLARTAAMRSTSDEMKRGRHAMSSLSAIRQSHHHHGHPIRSHSSPKKQKD